MTVFSECETASRYYVRKVKEVRVTWPNCRWRLNRTGLLRPTRTKLQLRHHLLRGARMHRLRHITRLMQVQYWTHLARVILCEFIGYILDTLLEWILCVELNESFLKSAPRCGTSPVRHYASWHFKWLDGVGDPFLCRRNQLPGYFIWWVTDSDLLQISISSLIPAFFILNIQNFPTRHPQVCSTS